MLIPGAPTYHLVGRSLQRWSRALAGLAGKWKPDSDFVSQEDSCLCLSSPALDVSVKGEKKSFKFPIKYSGCAGVCIPLYPVEGGDLRGGACQDCQQTETEPQS